MGHALSWPDFESIIYEENSERSLAAIAHEKEFVRLCRSRRWTIMRGNTFATHLLRPKWINRDMDRKRALRIAAALPRGDLGRLRALFRQSAVRRELSFGPYMVIVGLPDFVLLRSGKGRIPEWVEVKSGQGKLSREQRKALRELERLGYSTRVWYGGQFL